MVSSEETFIIDAGMNDLPFPIRAPSQVYPRGQPTVANISVQARIMREFEARWIDRFIQLLHAHREELGSAANMKLILADALQKLNANAVRVKYEYPFFIEKLTPIDKEKNLVRYLCSMTGRVTATREKPAIRLAMRCPIITTYPASEPSDPTGLFGQLSIVKIELESDSPTYPEDIAEIVDHNALQPVYSFLTQNDQVHVVKKIHSEYKPSLTTLNAIKEVLARNKNITHYDVTCLNYGMLHSYSTLTTIERSAWVPLSSYDEEDI
jgi:GTP cyclohydrolase FolE2